MIIAPYHLRAGPVSQPDFAASNESPMTALPMRCEIGTQVQTLTNAGLRRQSLFVSRDPSARREWVDGKLNRASAIERLY